MMSDPFHHEKRRRFTTLERAEFFAKANGHCQKCSRKIPFSDEWEIDHEIPLSLGGTNDDSNLRVMCSWCHDPKSDEDVSKAAKSKRVYAQHVVPKKHQRSRAWGWRR